MRSSQMEKEVNVVCDMLSGGCEEKVGRSERSEVEEEESGLARLAGITPRVHACMPCPLVALQVRIQHRLLDLKCEVRGMTFQGL
jgi:hypothetical protein